MDSKQVNPVQILLHIWGWTIVMILLTIAGSIYLWQTIELWALLVFFIVSPLAVSLGLRVGFATLEKEDLAYLDENYPRS